VREKDGMKLSLLYQTSTNAVRQDFQALIKQWWSEIGVETELRNIDASVFFGGDPARRTPSRSSMRTSKCTPTTSTAPIRSSIWATVHLRQGSASRDAVAGREHQPLLQRRI
jgi:ABC-type transport system substrate-binding protein